MNQQIANCRTVKIVRFAKKNECSYASFYCRKDVLLFSDVATKVSCENSRYDPNTNIAALKISSTLCVSMYTVRTMYYVHN